MIGYRNVICSGVSKGELHCIYDLNYHITLVQSQITISISTVIKT